MADAGERMDEDAIAKRNSRRQMMHYKAILEKFDVLDREDRAGIAGRKQIRQDTTNVMQMLTSCIGKSNTAFPTHWPKQRYETTLVKLVRQVASGELEQAPRNMLAPGNPKIFVAAVQKFIESGELPPETDSEKRTRERLEEEVRKAAEKATGANQGSSRRSGYGRFEEEAQQQERQRQDDEARERQRREEQWRWQRTREERARQRQYEREQQEQQRQREQQRQQQEQAQQRAEQERQRRAQEEAEAKKPENVFRKRIQGARQPNSLRVILSELDMAFAGFMPDGRTPLSADQRVSAALHRRLREDEIPARATEIFSARIRTAATSEALRSEFKDILTSGLFRGPKAENTISVRGGELLASVYTRAWTIFNEQIGNATRPAQLTVIQREIEGFLGGPLEQPASAGRRFGIFKPKLSEIERSKMSREHRQRYDKGHRGPHFEGPLSPSVRATIAAENNIVYMNPTDASTLRMVEDVSESINEKRAELEKAKPTRP